MFYVYQWYNVDTNEIFYIGKGCGKRAGQKSQRNKLFKDYISKNNCKYKIIEYFENEEDAFAKEHELITELKSKNQCKCNLDYGGVGGVNFVWTEEMRENKSINNPMKAQKQRERMKHQNPMQNKEIARKVAKSISKKVVIKNIQFDSLVQASKYFNVYPTEIGLWLKRGYDRDKEPCRYANKDYKEFTLKTTNSKPVIIDDMYFKSVKEASKYLNCYSECIIRAIKGNRKYKGHTCKYSNQQQNYTNT